MEIVMAVQKMPKNNLDSANRWLIRPEYPTSLAGVPNIKTHTKQGRPTPNDNVDTIFLSCDNLMASLVILNQRK